MIGGIDYYGDHFIIVATSFIQKQLSIRETGPSRL